VAAKQNEEFNQKGPNDRVDNQAREKKLEWMVHDVLGDHPGKMGCMPSMSLERRISNCFVS
jgi:hypothetical protein